MNENGVARCPKCHDEMEAGYQKLDHGFRWYPKDGSRSELLRLRNPLWPSTYDAWLCRKCHLLLVKFRDDEP